MWDLGNQGKEIECLFQAYKKMKCTEGHNIFNKYQIRGYLGNNSNRLYLGQDNFGNQVAIKENHNIQEMRKEVLILENLNHPNIIQYLDSCVLQLSNNKYHQEQLGYICMELGLYDLESYKKRNCNIGLELIEQTLSAFAYLQKQQIAHCDIKPANILVTSIQPITYKVCDVGSSKHQDSAIQSAVGTYKYMSPEMFNGEAKDYFLSDVFSLGLLYLSIFKGFPIQLEERRCLTDLQYIQKIHLLIDENDDVSNLLQKMLQLNPKDRMDFIDLELYWQNLQMLKIRQKFNYTQIRYSRVQSNYASIQDDSPLKNNYFKIGKYLKPTASGKNSNSKKDLIGQYHSISPQKQSILIEKRGISTAQKLQANTQPFDIYEKLQQQLQKPPISPQKSKNGSPKKTSNKFQLPQLKEKRTGSFKLRLLIA